MILPIRTYGDPVLRAPAQRIPEVTARVRALARDMLETMHGTDSGVGLAAQQVGSTLAICVIDYEIKLDQDDAGGRQNPEIVMPLVLINPEITSFSRKKESADEGCLSLPGISASIERSAEIVLRYLDLDGRARERPLKAFLARVVQHELDHLNGILLVDRMSMARKLSLRRRLNELKEETMAAGAPTL